MSLIVIALYPFGQVCPKCTLPNLVELRHCYFCDDFQEGEHLHKRCICGFMRIERCADAPPLVPPPSAPPASTNSSSSGGGE